MSRTCLICQTLATDPSEPQLHRLVRIYEQQLGLQANRLLTEGDRRVYERRIADLEQTIEVLNRTIARRTA